MSKHDKQARHAVAVHVVNAFTLNGSGGNPAGVVLDADALNEAAMQSIAAQTGLSEAAFVSRSPTEGARLDFFTPTRRIAHCGHATIAAFALMRADGRISDGPTSKHTVDGPRRIHVRDGAVFMEQRAPRYLTQADWAGTGVAQVDVLAAIGLSADRLDLRVAPQVVDTGNRFLLIGVASEGDLAGLSVDQGAVARISDALDLIGFYVFAVTGDRGLSHATTRMFAPRYGIPEESATGMAAGPLACLLHDVLGDRRTHFVIEQGRFMPSPSVSRILVDLEIEGGGIASLMAGGEGQTARTLQIEPCQPV
ncbi:PhzF family phenazine biosynthesis protein [Pseudosulfitobacter koreensis]|uniref:PhzF family phenazine biosynthesis protein n=1 Tax=Pseudosulfitobacter koreensis TaxID=2968472 RepID=A0ABT1Z3Z1_9RHOB|nr:PhzF family phenazine biosynthesis protein [Pseudosulfitobacter koreense]MCR8827862.1 PhzF family phenazine biosynthesis protein [Pseudosulfitobacter koreense]